MSELTGVGDFNCDGHVDLLIAVQSTTGKLFRYPGRGIAFRSAVQVGSSWTTDFRPLR